MKKVTLALLAAAVTGTALAQEGLGIEAGLNSTNVRTEIGNSINETDSKTGLRAGITYALPISLNLYLKPGVFYSNKGYQIMNNALGDFKTHLHYIEVPVNLGAKLPLMDGRAGTIFAEAGPYVAYAAGGTVKGKNIPVIGSSETKIEFGSASNETNPFDWGFNFGAGYETPWKVYIKGQYGLGLGNMNNTDNTTAYNRGWNVSLGYNF